MHLQHMPMGCTQRGAAQRPRMTLNELMLLLRDAAEGFL